MRDHTRQYADLEMSNHKLDISKLTLNHQQFSHHALSNNYLDDYSFEISHKRRTLMSNYPWTTNNFPILLCQIINSTMFLKSVIKLGFRCEIILEPPNKLADLTSSNNELDDVFDISHKIRGFRQNFPWSTKTLKSRTLSKNAVLTGNSPFENLGMDENWKLYICRFLIVPCKSIILTF